jgi:hypothetical protein
MNMKMKMSDLTLAGWLLSLLTIGIIIVLIISSLVLAFAILPGGRYPTMLMVLLAAPGFIVGIVLFALGALFLKAVGFPVIKATPEPSQQPPELPTE